MITRGQKEAVDRFINDLLAQYYPFNYKGKDNLVQLGVRPMQIWEIVMPEKCLGNVQKAIWDTNAHMDLGFKKQLGAMRLALGAKKVPTFDEKLSYRPVQRQDIACYPIGIKADRYDNNGEVL